MTGQRKLLLLIDSKDLLDKIQALFKRSFESKVQLLFANGNKEIERVLKMQRPHLVLIESSLLNKMPLEDFQSLNVHLVVIRSQETMKMQPASGPIHTYISSHEITNELPRILSEVFGVYPSARYDLDARHMSVSQSYINIWNADKIRPVKITDIIKIKSDGAYSEIYLKDNERLYTSRNIGVFEMKLKSHNFIRIHHSCLVNLEYIQYYKPGQKAYVSLNDAGVEYVSKSKKRCLLDHFILFKREESEE